MEQTAGVHLVRSDENVAEIDALAADLGGRVGLAGVLDDLDRRARRTWAPGRAVRRALTWDAADRRDPDWWPQGISSSAEAGEPGRVLVVSWYSKRGAGSRVSVLDLERRRYRHVLLVEPVLDERGRAGVRPLEVHAGGLVWHAPYLHVAATGRGLVTCRLDDVLRVPPGSGLETHGHRYVLPVRFAYRAATAAGCERLRYSFVSLEPTEPALVVGEYGAGSQTRRLVRYPVDPGSRLLAAREDGTSHPLLLEEQGVVRTQGVAVVDGRYHVTRSRGPWLPGSVHVGRPGAWRRYRWATPMGPEDLTWWPGDDLLWSVSEHPRRRWVFAMPRRLFD